MTISAHLFSIVAAVDITCAHCEDMSVLQLITIGGSCTALWTGSTIMLSGYVESSRGNR